jgi:cysteine desulfurase
LIYLDYNATAPVRPEVVSAVTAALQLCGNPSSVHALGRAARAKVEEARVEVARLAGARTRDVIFTSGGTEANNLALKGCGRKRLLVSAAEHSSVIDIAKSWPGDCVVLPVDSQGVVDLAALDAALGDEARDAVVSLMLANNETGVIQPVTAAAALVHTKGGLLHSDAVQALGKIPVDFKALSADMMTLSAHKIGGPQGVGALVVAPGLDLQPLLQGGGQEFGRRSGTENLPGIAGFGVAALTAGAAPAVEALRDELEARLEAAVPGVMIAGKGAARLGNTSCIVMPGVAAETQIMAFDLAGICLSSGAACSSGKLRPSHVLGAMGFGADARSAIRVSLGPENTIDDVSRFLAVWLELYQRTRQGAVL